jgi:hypothetical protein
MTETECCDVLGDHPGPVLEWLHASIHDRIVRKIAYETVVGWRIKIAVEGHNAVDRFWTRWLGEDAILDAPARRVKLLHCIRDEHHGPTALGTAHPA